MTKEAAALFIVGFVLLVVSGILIDSVLLIRPIDFTILYLSAILPVIVYWVDLVINSWRIKNDEYL